MQKTRLEAFSDGVIAIIITIMVLEFKIPSGADWQALKPLIPVFLCYLLSFVFIGIYWASHHHLFHIVKTMSVGIIWSNMNLLFWLSLVPFVTGWMGENQFKPFPVAVYAVLLILCGVAYTILQKTIEKEHKNVQQLEDIMKRQSRKGFLSLVIYAAAVPLAYVNTIFSGLLFVAVAILWIIPDKRIKETINN